MIFPYTKYNAYNATDISNMINNLDHCKLKCHENVDMKKTISKFVILTKKSLNLLGLCPNQGQDNEFVYTITTTTIS